MGAIDIVIILLLIMFAVVGWKQGVIKEVVQLGGMVVILVISFMFKDELGNVFCKWLPFFDFTGSPVEGMVSLNILIYQLLVLHFQEKLYPVSQTSPKKVLGEKSFLLYECFGRNNFAK